jgi:hypothetical protein
VAALRVCATPINRAGQYTTLPDATTVPLGNSLQDDLHATSHPGGAKVM